MAPTGDEGGGGGAGERAGGRDRVAVERKREGGQFGCEDQSIGPN